MRVSRLVLIRGDGQDGTVFSLERREVTLGRTRTDIVFPDDPSISPHHCSFTVGSNGVTLVDRGSTNGVFLRLKQPVPLADDQVFLCGEQVFRFERFRPIPVSLGVDGAVFGGTPIAPWRFRIVQILTGGHTGLAFCARKRSVTIGREDCDINFYQDPYISHYHARIEERTNQFFLTDLDSRNGTFVRAQGELSLESGDYLFIGRQLLRFEDA